jgi:hypothetical protein
MNPELERELEEQIGRALQGLPDLAAPPALFTRTMNALQKPAASPAQAWNRWPVSARIAFFVLASITLVAAVIGWRAGAPGLLAAIHPGLAFMMSGVKCVWDVLGALMAAAALEAQHLGKIFMVACLLAVAGACAVCAGCGTIFVRLALARPVKS